MLSCVKTTGLFLHQTCRVTIVNKTVQPCCIHIFTYISCMQCYYNKLYCIYNAQVILQIT